LHEAPVLEDALVRGARVKVREIELEEPFKDTSSPPYPEPGAVLVDLPAARVGGVQVEHGAFTYEVVKDAQIARIELHDIEAEIGSFATRKELVGRDYDRPLDMRAEGRLEHSGAFDVKVRFEPFAAKNEDEIGIDVRRQDMAELGSFFAVESGIRTSGSLTQAHASLHLSQGVLAGKLAARYSGFHFEVIPNPRHGNLKSALMQTLLSMKYSSEQPKAAAKSQASPEIPVNAQRDPHMPIIKWILKGLKPAAEKILSS
jgi:hypothetical protein